MKNEIAQFKDIHKNKRCFLLGNGPSLLEMPLDKLQDEITIGCNRIYKTDKITPTYYCIEDVQMTRRIGDKIVESLPDKTVKFISKNCNLADKMKNAYDVNFIYFYRKDMDAPPFSRNLDKACYLGHSVMYMAMQVAYYLGCNPVYCLGMDGIKEDKPVHFYEENDNVHKANAARDRARRAFMKAKEEFEKDDRKIYQATPDPVNPYFEQVDIDEIL